MFRLGCAALSAVAASKLRAAASHSDGMCLMAGPVR